MGPPQRQLSNLEPSDFFRPPNKATCLPLKKGLLSVGYPRLLSRLPGREGLASARAKVAWGMYGGYHQGTALGCTDTHHHPCQLGLDIGDGLSAVAERVRDLPKAIQQVGWRLETMRFFLK